MFVRTDPPSRPRTPLVLWAMCVLGGCASGDPSANPAAGPPELARLPAGATLIGLGGGDLEGVMGQPALIRQEGAAQYWRYGLSGCQLDLFLYADPESGAARVTYLDVRPAQGQPPARTDGCADLASRLRAGAAQAESMPGPPVSAPL